MISGRGKFPGRKQCTAEAAVPYHHCYRILQQFGFREHFVADLHCAIVLSPHPEVAPVTEEGLDLFARISDLLGQLTSTGECSARST